MITLLNRILFYAHLLKRASEQGAFKRQTAGCESFWSHFRLLSVFIQLAGLNGLRSIFTANNDCVNQVEEQSMFDDSGHLV